MKPSRWRGFGAAVGVSVLCGAVIAGLTIVTGAWLALLWWPLGWLSGYAAQSASRTADQGVGLLAFIATIIGMAVSGGGFDERNHIVIIPGGLFLLVTLIGSLWLAFRTGSSKEF